MVVTVTGVVLISLNVFVLLENTIYWDLNEEIFILLELIAVTEPKALEYVLRYTLMLR